MTETVAPASGLVIEAAVAAGHPTAALKTERRRIRSAHTSDDHQLR